MFKKFIENAIRTAIEKEFNFKCNLQATVRINKEVSNPCSIDFEFDTIYLNNTVHGIIYSFGEVRFQEDDAYYFMKDRYKKESWELEA